jgi:hypothetical protein
MSGYVLKREDGKYVAQPGQEKSYTSSLERARIFDTREQAEQERCGNEHIVSVDSILQR